MVIGFSGVFIATQTYQTNKIQTEVARNSVLPDFVINEEVLYDEETEKSTDMVIEISNLEGRLNNYHSNIVTVLQCQYVDEEANEYQAELPVENYYIVGNRSGKSTGSIEKRRTAGNYLKWQKLETDIRNYTQNSGISSLSAVLKSYVKISYTNLLGEKEEIYYQVDSFQTELMDKENGQNKFENYNLLCESNLGINFNEAKEVQVVDLINTICGTAEKNM